MLTASAIESTPEQRALVVLAVEHWNDDDALFSDAQVAQVKALFAAVFEHDRPLQGLSIGDALLLFEYQDDGLFYVVVPLSPLEKHQLVWMKLAVRAPCFDVLCAIGLGGFLRCMPVTLSAAKRVDSTKAELLGDAAALPPVFGAMHDSLRTSRPDLVI